MLDIEKALKYNWILKPLTGMSITKFQQILILFRETVEKDLTGNRKHIKGRKHSLHSLEDKLFFILLYINCYPTFELLAFLYGVHRSQICRWVKELEPVLNKSIGLKIHPHKKPVKHFDEFINVYPEIKSIFTHEVYYTEQSIKLPVKKSHAKYIKLINVLMY
ncbi:MAG: transposase family protein [Candidatus Eremiobacterota bacterium]